MKAFWKDFICQVPRCISGPLYIAIIGCIVVVVTVICSNNYDKMTATIPERKCDLVTAAAVATARESKRWIGREIDHPYCKNNSGLTKAIVLIVTTIAYMRMSIQIAWTDQVIPTSRCEQKSKNSPNWLVFVWFLNMILQNDLKVVDRPTVTKSSWLMGGKVINLRIGSFVFHLDTLHTIKAYFSKGKLKRHTMHTLARTLF